MKTKTNKTDLVKKMREIRDKFSLEIMNMTFEQEKEYIKNQLADLKQKKQFKPHEVYKTKA
jgi:hypothetical protein